MLFVASRTIDQHVEAPLRVLLIEKLQERGLVPFVRTARLHAYELILPGAERARELERALAIESELEGRTPYVRGELFCFEDFAHFLIFGDTEQEGAGVRAGIVYESETDEPQQKLAAFCSNVAGALAAARHGADGAGEPLSTPLPFQLDWQAAGPPAPESFTRFTGRSDATTTAPVRSTIVSDWLRVAGLLEDTEARQVLRSMTEAQQAGRTAVLLAGGDEGQASEPMVNRLAEAGLLRREVLISCRKDGRSLFRLPSADALSVLNASNAICTECGAAIADEKAEEIVVPTALTNTLLQDGSWLTTHLRSILVRLGLPDEQIATRPVSGDGEAQLLAHLYGEAFLFLLRDGDWTAAQTRRAAEELTQSGPPPHLVIVATGRIPEDARLRLREQTRRTHGARASEVLFVEGMDTVMPELQPVFERIMQTALTEELWPLDGSLGLNVAHLLAVRFRLLHKSGALHELASAAAGALAGSLHEF